MQSVLHKSELDPSDPIIKIAMHDYLVNISNYLDIVPLISQIQLWYSPNKSIQDEGSQFSSWLCWYKTVQIIYNVRWYWWE